MIIQSHQSSLSFGPAQMGSKRGRLLIRQQRIKKENETVTTQATDLDTPEATTYSQCLLTVPSPKIERHVSEPTSIQATTHNFLAVPQTSILIKQHSHPLLPSQSHSPPTSTYTLQRQLSHPISAISGGIGTSLSSSPMSSVTAYSTTPILVTTAGATTTTLAQISTLMGTSLKSEPSDDDSHSHHTHLQQLQHQHSFEHQRTHTSSPTVVIIQDSSIAPTMTTNDVVPTTLTLTKPRSEELARSVSTPQTSSVSRELSLDNPRSSHCPVVRPGPALGCNFCWNTIDAHGRILRRKTKYHCPECQTNLCIVPCFQEYHERQSSENPPPVNDNKPTGWKHYAKSGSM